MSRKESDFLKRLLVTFQGEAEERVRSLASGLIELEKVTDPAQKAEVVELVFREVHSLKGAARSVNLMDIEAICQAMEDVFAALKRQKITTSLALLDLLHQATDVLKGLLATGTIEQGGGDRARHMPLIRQLKEMAKQNPAAASAPAPVATPVPPATPAPAPVSTPEPAPPAPVATDSLEVLAENLNAADIEVQPDENARDAANDWHLETATQSRPQLQSQSRPLPEEKPVAAETVRISANGALVAVDRVGDCRHLRIQ